MNICRIFAFIFLAIVCGCKKDTSIDPQLLGLWDDFNTIYTFNNDFTYSQKYYHFGYGKDSVKIDSIFGRYELDRKKSNLFFFQKGYREKSTGLIITQELSGNSWSYNIESDTILRYTSNNSLGKLIKK